MLQSKKRKARLFGSIYAPRMTTRTLKLAVVRCFMPSVARLESHRVEWKSLKGRLSVFGGWSDPFYHIIRPSGSKYLSENSNFMLVVKRWFSIVPNIIALDSKRVSLFVLCSHFSLSWMLTAPRGRRLGFGWNVSLKTLLLLSPDDEYVWHN